jgi:hypothetical protein
MPCLATILEESCVSTGQSMAHAQFVTVGQTIWDESEQPNKELKQI